MAESEVGPIPPNKLTHFANALRKGREVLDKVNFTLDMPWADFHGEMGAGELLMGQAPEVLEQASYGFMPWTGKGQTFTLKPEVVDVVGLPTFGAAAGSKMAVNALRRGARRASGTAASVMGLAGDEAVDQSRRSFLKGAGAAAVTAGAAGTGASVLPDLLRKSAVKQVAKAAVPSSTIVTKTLDEMAQRNLPGVIDSVVNRNFWDPKRFPEQYAHYEKVSDYLKNLDLNELRGSDLYISGQKETMEDFIDLIRKEHPDVDPEMALRRVLADPNAEYPTPDKDIGSRFTWPSKDGHSWNPRYMSVDEMKELGLPDADKWHELVEEADVYVSTNLSDMEVDVFQATGRLPKDFPEELKPYVDVDYLLERGGKLSAWDDIQGMYYGMDEMFQEMYERKVLGPTLDQLKGE